MSYALYKFHKAICSLHDRQLDKRQWLASHYIHHIVHLQEATLPVDIRQEFCNVRNILTKISANTPSEALQCTLNVMNDAEIEQVITRLENMYEHLQRSENFSRMA
jgi:hypothetical protein